jgi:hypothetical protein
MASTRNKNTPGDYQLESDKYIANCSYNTASEYGRVQTTYLPGDGLIGAKIPGSELSKNPWDIESELFGIGSTNLVEPKKTVVHTLNKLACISNVNRIPLFVPAPINISTTERPNVMN